MEKLVSVIVPCYNVENYIDRCVDSLVKQTLGLNCMEIILVDDCSTDCTWDHLTSLEHQYPESIIVVHCDENGRQGRARNIGLQYATAPYIGYVDADDWIEPDMYEKLYQKCSENNCDIAMCQSWREYGKIPEKPSGKTGKDDRILQIDTLEKRKLFLACSSIGFEVWNKLYKTELLKQNAIYFPEKLAYEDHFFCMLLYFYAERVYILEERLYHYVVNEQSTVMVNGAHHHFDILTVDMMLWEECSKRGFVKQFRLELEYQFLSLCYLGSVKMLLLRLSGIPYDFFRKLKKETLLRVPDYHANPYVRELVTDSNKILLELLDKDMAENELKLFFQTLREYVKKGSISI